MQIAMPTYESAGILISRPKGSNRLPIVCCQIGGTFGVKKKTAQTRNITPQVNR